MTRIPKTHCGRGHEFTEATTYWPPNGRFRQCRACQREDSAARYATWYRALDPDGRRRLLLDRGLGAGRTPAPAEPHVRGLRAPQRDLGGVQAAPGGLPGGSG